MIVPQLVPNATVGRYVVGERLGQGTRGVVHLASNRETGQTVALKIMIVADDMEEKEARLRFEREAEALARFSHPHIVGYEGAATLNWDGHSLPCLAMEFLPDLQPLDAAWRGIQDQGWLLDRLEELLTALDYMHTHRHAVVHRDLKPANLGIPRDGRLKVLDLGLARIRESDLTKGGTWLGSLGYMAPEQLMDAHRVDARADVYSVGMILLEMLGGHPLGNMTSAKAVRTIVSGRIPPTPNPVPEPLDALARWFIAASPADRPNSARTALQELKGVRQRLKQAAPVAAPRPAQDFGSVSGYLGQQLLQARNGQGGAVVISGQTAVERNLLMDAARRQAELMGMFVLKVQSSAELASRLGTRVQSQAMFDALAAVADRSPTLVCVEDWTPYDGELWGLMDLSIVSGERMLLVVASERAPSNAGAIPVFQLQ